MSAQPNFRLIQTIAAAKDAYDIGRACTGGSPEESLIDVIQWILSGDWRDNYEKACVIEFCLRHGGLTMHNAGRFIGMAKTNCCGTCGYPGHNKNHCNR